MSTSPRQIILTKDQFKIEVGARCLILYRNCPSCLEKAIGFIKTGFEPMGPTHENSRYCKSGKRPHCSCDMCF